MAFQGLPVSLALPPGAVAGGRAVGITVAEVSAASFLASSSGVSTSSNESSAAAASGGSDNSTRVFVTGVYNFGPDGTQ